MSKRRDFIGRFIALTFTGLWSTNLLSNTKQPLAVLGTKKPKKPSKEGIIALIAPAFFTSKEKIDRAEKDLTAMGYQVVRSQYLSDKYGYFSQTDELRAKDLMRAFMDPEIEAIVCVRGGYGTTRILDLLDYNAIANHPKPLIGFSDITALLQAIHKKTGLIGFHGPVGSALDQPYTRAMWTNLWRDGGPGFLMNSVDRDQIEDQKKNEYQRITLNPGRAKGKLVGGSLTLINALIGTEYEIDFTDKIVIIEEVGEKPYRVDRMLTQLLMTDTFKKAKGFALGVWVDCDQAEGSTDGFSLIQVLEDRLTPTGIPCCYGMSFGHTPWNMTLPIGAEVSFDADLGNLTLEESIWSS